jgi:hypothetical protein
VADETELAAGWPLYYEGLVAQTPFRSVASLPLRSHRPAYVGALDLHSSEPDASAFDAIHEVDIEIAGPITAILFDAPSSTIQSLGVTVPSWLNNERGRTRMNVWVGLSLFVPKRTCSPDD